jgi:hypothetical protein
VSTSLPLLSEVCNKIKNKKLQPIQDTPDFWNSSQIYHRPLHHQMSQTAVLPPTADVAARDCELSSTVTSASQQAGSSVC